MISICEVLNIKPNRSSLAFRKPTTTKSDYGKESDKKVDSYRKIVSRTIDNTPDVKAKTWGSKKMK